MLFQKHKILIPLLILLHFGLGIVSYLWSIRTQSTDYWNIYQALNVYEIGVFRIGNVFFIFFNVIFRSLDFWAISLLYIIFSFLPFYYFYSRLKEEFQIEKDLFRQYTIILLLYLPSVHLWLASFSKDAFCFSLLVFLIYLLSEDYERKRFLLAVFCWLPILLVRPYLAIIVLLSGLIIYRNSIRPMYFIMLFLILGVIIYIFIFQFVKFEDVDLEYIRVKFASLNEYAKTGNSSIDLEDTTIFSRFFYMMFRPFITEAVGFSQMVVAIENILLLIWFILLFINSKKVNFFRTENKQAQMYIAISLGLWLFYSIYIYNYGLASRMKATILPILFYGVLQAMAKPKEDKS